MTTKTKISSRIFHLHSLSERIARAVDATEGEVTPDIGEMLDLADMNRDELLEALAQFHHEGKETRRSIALEKGRLSARDTEIEVAQEWAEKQIGKLLEGYGTETIGTFKVSKHRGSPSVKVHEDPEGESVISFAAAFPEYFAVVSAVPETKRLDKKAVLREWRADRDVRMPRCVSVAIGPDSIKVR